MSPVLIGFIIVSSLIRPLLFSLSLNVNAGVMEQPISCFSFCFCRKRKMINRPEGMLMAPAYMMYIILLVLRN
ncbi:MAG: hypothetical protein ACLFPE_04585 [Bacteroidales bacterium]